MVEHIDVVVADLLDRPREPEHGARAFAIDDTRELDAEFHDACINARPAARVNGRIAADKRLTHPRWRTDTARASGTLRQLLANDAGALAERSELVFDDPTRCLPEAAVGIQPEPLGRDVVK